MPDPTITAELEAARITISPYVPRVRTEATSTELQKLRGSYKLVDTLRNWLADSNDKETTILWLQSQSAVKLSAIMYDAGKGLKMPVLAYSCRQLAENSKDIPAKTLFVQMLYAFLDALLEYLKDSNEVTNLIDAADFANLKGDFDTAAQAIVLLGKLLGNTPRICVCIIDNFERLDKPDLKPLLKDFLGLFQHAVDGAPAQEHGCHKLCLTTRGSTGLLSDMSKKLKTLKTDDHLGKEQYRIWEEFNSGSQAST